MTTAKSLATVLFATATVFALAAPIRAQDGLVVLDGPKVGIGTTEPTVELEVNGDAKATGTSEADSLAGARSAYACIDEDGTLFPSETPCVTGAAQPKLYYPISPPCRVLDTRQIDPLAPLPPGSTTTFKLTGSASPCAIPDGAGISALAMNLTVLRGINPSLGFSSTNTGSGYLEITAAGAFQGPPQTSSVNRRGKEASSGIGI